MPSNPRDVIIERLPGYQDPPTAPLPPLISAIPLEDLGVNPTPASMNIHRKLWKLNGFWRFYHQLTPTELEHLLRTVNVRVPGLYSPVISATAVLHPSKRKVHWLQRATALVLAAISFYNDLLAGSVEQDFIKNHPLEMGEYPNLFGTVLTVKKHSVRLNKCQSCKWILVISNGWFYLIPIKKEFHELFRLLEACYVDSQKRESALNRSLGWITASENRVQYFSWHKLRKNPRNRSILEKINNTLFTLCLDAPLAPDSIEEAARLIHIDNPGNRFYLAGTQIVVFANGMAGALFNFTAYIDGNPMCRFTDELFKRSEVLLTQNRVDPDAIPPEEAPEPFAVSIPMPIIVKAKRSIRKIIDGQRHVFELPGYGRKAFGPFHRDAIPLTVLAIAAAVHELTGKVPYIDQFVSLAHFRALGLTRVNVTTPETVEASIHLNTEKPEAVIWNIIEKSIQSQKNKIRNARMYMPVSILEILYLNSRRPLKKMWVFATILIRDLLIRFRRLKLKPVTDILLSHPRIVEGSSYLGRAGIRLPYVRQFGLHYFVYPEKLVLAYMPGVQWGIPNALMTVKIREKLDLIRFLIQQQDSQTRTMKQSIASSSRTPEASDAKKQRQ